MVPLPRRPGLAPAGRSGRNLQEVATLAVRPRRSQPAFEGQGTRVWAGLLWSMALLGLFLLPSNFRAGGEIVHGHSLLQLWADASDGHVDHHLHAHAGNSGRGPLLDWLDPAADAALAQSVPDQECCDVGEHNDSTPVPGTLLLTPLNLVPFLAIAGERLPTPRKEDAPSGCCPEVLLPPPR